MAALPANSGTEFKIEAQQCDFPGGGKKVNADVSSGYVGVA